jgi:hypothetical protein
MGTANPGWVVPGMNVYDATAGASSGSTDSLVFSAWPAASASSGSEPSTTPASATNTNAAITFPQATASWGTVVAWGLYDAATAGDLVCWDYLGNYKWVPFTCTAATPGVMTTDSTTDAPANGSSIVVTAKFGGTLPTTSGSWSGLLTTAGLSGNTFNAGVTTTITGAGQFRQVTQQAIPANVTASFAINTLTVSAA